MREQNLDTFCECREDWTDGGALCQECGKPRRQSASVMYDDAPPLDSFPTLCQEPNCPGGRTECHTFATFEDAEDEIDDILRRADDWDLYDGDEDQQWIFENRVLPDLKKLADAYRQLKGTGCVFIPTGDV